MLNNDSNYIINHIANKLNDIDSNVEKITICVLLKDGTTVGNDNNFLRYSKEKDKISLYENNQKVLIGDNYLDRYRAKEKFILKLLNNTVYYPQSKIIIAFDGLATYTLDVPDIHLSNNKSFDGLFKVIAKLPNYSCDDENCRNCKKLYRDVNKFLDNIDISETIDQYIYLCDKTEINGKMTVLISNDKKIVCYILENPYGGTAGDYEFDGGCMMFSKLEGEFQRGFVGEVVCRLAVYCSHTDIWMDGIGWCHSHGENDFPVIDYESISISVSGITNVLERYAQKAY